jgi:putative hemolysin
MTAQVIKRSQPFPALLIFVILATMMLAVVAPNFHSLHRHGSSAISASYCFSGGGEIRFVRFNPVTGRKAEICEANGSFFVRISQDGQTITMFPKDKMHCLEQVIQYLENTGYVVP